MGTTTTCCNQMQIQNPKRTQPSTLMSKAYDPDYKSKQRLNIFQAHIHCMNNPYNPQSNQDGFINFGTSFNSVIPKTTLNYLPKFLTQDDCPYTDPTGYDHQFYQHVCIKTSFNPKQTYCFSHMTAILSTLCHSYGKVHVIGEYQQMNAIMDHSRAIKVNPQQAKIIVFFVSKDNIANVPEVKQKHANQVIVFVVKSKQQIANIKIKQSKEAVVYQNCLKQTVKLGIAHSKDKQILTHLSHGWVFFPVSNIIRKVSMAPETKTKINDTSTQPIRKMIQISTNTVIDQQNLWITLGAGSALDQLSRAIFKKGNLCVDSPYYAGFDHDFANSGVKMTHKSMFEKTNVQRMQQALKQGCVGYVICNPHNPIGTVLSKEQVSKICQWAKDKPNFHLIFDQMYLNTCRNIETLSAASYAIKYPNIHVVRGMAKDFGLCGIKIGITISSNPNVIQKFRLWKSIMSHDPLTISIINQMIVKSNYGQDIISYGKQLLNQYFQQLFQLFNTHNIPYIKPQGGCFFFLDLRKYLKEKKQDQQYLLWKKMFYKYRVNLSGGIYFHAPQPGYFRICPITDKQTMREGMKRIFAALQDQSN